MTKFLLHIPLLIGLLLVPALGWADFQAGVDASERGDYETALKEFRPLANKGDKRAQTILGEMHLLGIGVPRNYEEAGKWYRLAALQGVSQAQYWLGALYYDRLGESENYPEAMKWYKLAANQGHSDAQHGFCRK